MHHSRRTLAIATGASLLAAFFVAPAETTSFASEPSPSVAAPSPTSAPTSTTGHNPGVFELENFGALSLLVSVGFVGAPAGTTFSLSTTSGLTPAAGYDFTAGTTWSNLDRISFIADQTAANAALASLRVNTGTALDEFQVRVSATENKAGLVYNPKNEHFYRYVSTLETWPEARADATSEAREEKGVRGYLASITSGDEALFLTNNVTTDTRIWVGGAQVHEGVVGSTNSAAVWRWVDAPAAEYDLSFYGDPNSRGGNQTGADASPYYYWCPGEPNNDPEPYLAFRWGAGDDAQCWNDWGSAVSDEAGYIIEYSEEPGQSYTGVYTNTTTVSVSHQITYDANASQHQPGATNGSVPPSQFYAGEAVTAAAAGTLSRTGFTFDGWNTASNGSGTSYAAGDSISGLTEPVTLYAKWKIPGAARLFGMTDDDGVRQETISPITASGSGLAGNIRGITTNGSSVFFVPNTSTAVSPILREVNFDGSLIANRTLTGNEAAKTAFAAIAGGNRDLTYSKGCIFFRSDGNANSTLYCIDTTNWSINAVAITGNGFLAGQGWLTGNLIDFPDGRIGAVSANNHATGASGCPVNFYCKTLRVYTVDNQGSGSVTVTFDRDIILADHENPTRRSGYDMGDGWPDDDHGIATDGTYLYQSRHARGYKVWALQSDSPSYIVFNGDGPGTCGANTGVSGGLCPISFSKAGLTIMNATYFGRDHVNSRYLMGDYDRAQIIHTTSATDQPASEFTITAPNSPQSVTASGGDEQATVSWNAPTGDAPIVNYTATASPGGQTCTAVGTSCVITGLTNGTAYTFSVVASNNGGSSDPSASSSAVTPSSIPKINQEALQFVSASALEIGGTLTLSAAGGSGSGTISYAKVSGPCTLEGSVVTATGEGDCVVTATRTGDDTYNPLTTSGFTITVSKAAQTINFTSAVPSAAVAGTTYTPVATATSALTVAFTVTTGSPTVCQISGGVVTFNQSGTCVIAANQEGNSTFAAASAVTQTIVAGKINQTITFPAITAKEYGDPAFAAGASVSSGRAISYVSADTDVCQVGATTGIVTITTTGTCTITASSVGNASYADASPVSRTFTIAPILPGVPNITSVSFGDRAVTVAFVAPGENGGSAIAAYQVVATRDGHTVTKPDCATTSPCTITGLTNGFDYTLTVQAINGAGVGPASAASPAVRPASVPNAVTGLVTTPGNGQLSVDWTAVSNSGLGGGTFTRYDVFVRERGQAWGAAVTVDGSNLLDAQATNSYTFTALTNGTAYDVKVVAVTTVNAQELSSNTVLAWGVPATVPEPPTDLALTALSNTQALASWSAPTDDGGAAISSYLTGQTCTFAVATDTYCTLSGLTAGSTLSFTVGATNLIGTSSTVSASITLPGGGSGGTSGGVSRTPEVTPEPTPGPRFIPRRIIGPVEPTPEPRLFTGPVSVPGRGFDPGQGTRATIGGLPATVSNRPLEGGGGISVQTGALRLNVTVDGGTGGGFAAGGASTPELRVTNGHSTRVGGGGLLPGSHLQIWLPGQGSTPQELARIPVKSDGTFESDVSFVNRLGDAPLPIGRQVMQVTGYDDMGRATVVDLTVNIAQGAPNPEPNRVVNALPSLGAGESLATSSGIPESVVVTAVPERGQVDIVSGDWSFNIALSEDSGSVERVPTGATISLVQSQTAVVSGVGFQPETRVDIWLFSEPTLLGSVVVGADGSFTGEVYLDPRFALIGSHTLQLQGVATDGYVKAANIGVVVDESPSFTAASALALMMWLGGGLLFLAFLFFLIGAIRRNENRRTRPATV